MLGIGHNSAFQALGRFIKGDTMKLIKILTAFIALASLQIAAAQWLNVPPPAEARNLMVVGGGVPVAGASLKDSNTAATATLRQVGRYAPYLYTGGNFAAGSSYTLSSVKVSIYRTGTATGTIVAHIWATSAGAPTGSPLQTSNAVNRSTIPTSSTMVEFTGFTQAITSGTEYCIILQASVVNGDETVDLEFSSGGGAYVNEQYNDADGTTPFSADQNEYIKFETYGT